MKKLLTLLAGIAIISALFTACPLDPKEDDIPVAKLSTFKFNTNHPWNDGEQDLTVISNYQKEIVINRQVGALKKGDKFKVVLKGTSDIDVPEIYVRAIDNSEAANWWKELDEKGVDGTVLVKNAKAGEKIDVEVTITLSDDPIENIALCIWYDKSVGEEATITVQ